MEGFKIDEAKLAARVADCEQVSKEAYAEFGFAYVHTGASSAHTKDRKRHACLMAGCVDGLKDIQRSLSVYSGDGGKAAFDRSHDRAVKNMSWWEPNTREHFWAQGVEMAYRTVLNNCLVSEKSAAHDVPVSLEEQLQAAEAQKAPIGETKLREEQTR